MRGSAGCDGPEAPTDSDSELLARHVAGDHDAFGVLVRRHRDRLWAVALRTLGDREEAADALQDALVSAFRAAHTFQGRSAVTTWLHRIVVNACLDRARRSARHRTRPLDEEPALDSALGHDEGADASVERGELRQELATALASLPIDQRAALVLVDMHGYPVAEAALILGVPVGTVKSRCARGRARLLPRIAHLRTGVPPGRAPTPGGPPPDPQPAMPSQSRVSRTPTPGGPPPDPRLTTPPQSRVSRETGADGRSGDQGDTPALGKGNLRGSDSVPLLAAPPVKDSRAGGEPAK